MTDMQQNAYEEARIRAKEAFQVCLQGDAYLAQRFLLRTRNELKRLSGDLPIVRHNASQDDQVNTPFTTRTFEEAQSWGWLEMATGAYQLMRDRPGAALVHFKRAWRIWRPWAMKATIDQQNQEARRERARAGLWLGEAWARIMNER